MPLDIKLVREHPDIVRVSEKNRFKDESIVDEVLQSDQRWRAEESSLNKLRHDLGKTHKQISSGRKSLSEESSREEPELKERKNALQAKIQASEVRRTELHAKRETQLRMLGNLLHGDVPISENDAGNRVLRLWGTPFPRKPGDMPHWCVLEQLGAFDSERGVRVAGRRGYFLRGQGVLLNMALINYGLSFLVQRGYLALQPPYFMRQEVMALTAELDDFHQQLYPMMDASNMNLPSETKSDDFYLIATSEQPVSAFHQGEVLQAEDLPLRYVAISPCFRRETGSHGLDAKGLFRVHQFEKVEQFCLSKPEDSWRLHEQMMATSEEFFQSLGLPYRVVDVASGALNNAAARKYDLEGWFPSAGEYRELVSCSNCTDFQARALGTHMQGSLDRLRAPVHMLNGTLCATERTMCCIAENFQTEEGMVVPRVLVPFMGGTEMIRFE